MPRFTTSDDLSLHYSSEGDGTPIVCLAGLTRSGRDFDDVAPHLAECRLIRLDYRGRGRSDWAESESYTIPVEARDVVELLDHLGLPRAAILGTSRGGLVAMQLAATAKDRLTGVALNDVGPEIAPEGLQAIEAYIGRNPPFSTLDGAARAMADRLPGFDGVPLKRWRDAAERQFRETPEGLVINYDPGLRKAFLDAGAQPAADMWPLFDALDGLPLALIRGENSNILSPETAAQMRHRRPDMDYAEVPDRGHVPFLDEPQALAALRSWVARL
ncbi:alpha/beta fold hydrolase [Tranquillimonas rosea]|uniref:alpha/beta fold hydrolase n=1 Tax=Tranquillimonas rosea TaxID=641238 RepID=UPI003BA9DCBE